MCKKRVRAIREIAEAEGWLSDVVITVNGSGHYKVMATIDQHRLTFTVSSTPSCPHSLDNFRRDIHRRIMSLPSEPIDRDAIMRAWERHGLTMA